MPVRMATAAPKNPIVVTAAQNILAGGSQQPGIAFNRPGMSTMWTMPKEMGQVPKRSTKKGHAAHNG
jgi:hypothetical protein